jgi:hypothetical protein
MKNNQSNVNLVFRILTECLCSNFVMKFAGIFFFVLLSFITSCTKLLKNAEEGVAVFILYTVGV